MWKRCGMRDLVGSAKLGGREKRRGIKGKWKNVIRREKRISKSGRKWEDIGRERGRSNERGGNKKMSKGRGGEVI